ERYFRQALEQYHSERDYYDIERTWIYLGHVACDTCKYDRSLAQQLWGEISKQLSLGFDIEHFEHFLNYQKQRYTIHLLIKGVYSFGTSDDFKTFLGTWQKDNYLSSMIEKMVAGTVSPTHPYGLICQIIGMLYERLFEEAGTES
ncbi:MAG: hypothetical protein Q4G59_06035, partial [Planctomycetia bacterium]|nr:hypothetical protein [Planctomycetia bacterium]